MDQNTETPKPDNEPLFEEPPVPQPSSEPAETAGNFVSAADEVIDVQSEPVPQASYSDEPPLQPEIVNGPTQAPPKKSSNGWVISLIVLLVLCCCCVLLIVPLYLLGNVLSAVFVSVYNAIISILNSIFGGSIRFY